MKKKYLLNITGVKYGVEIDGAKLQKLSWCVFFFIAALALLGENLIQSIFLQKSARSFFSVFATGFYWQGYAVKEKVLIKTKYIRNIRNINPYLKNYPHPSPLQRNIYNMNKAKRRNSTF